MPTELCVLKGARELISDPAKWTQGSFARNGDGERVTTTSSSAICWCSLGALMLAEHQCGRTDGKTLTDAVHALGAAMRGNIAIFNDDHTHAEVLARFDAAILAVLSENQTPSAKEGR